MENKHTKEDLKMMQAWPLERKIQVTQTRIMEWYMRWQGKVYVSFSGGKDSTVLLDLARRCYPDIPAVFCDTGLEYPEIREFVKTINNVEFIYPQKYDQSTRKYKRVSFKDVISECGYPIISKEVSLKVKEARRKPDGYAAQSFDPNSPKNQKYPTFSLERYSHLINAPFSISDECCKYMKKIPAKRYEKQSGRKPIIGTLACESTNRKTKWLQNGCNAFKTKRPTSQPLSFWTEQDILHYLILTGIPYCSVYGEITRKNDQYGNSGLERTGCMFCMFGCQFEKEPNRFQRMKETHPKQYEYCIKPVEDGGLGLGTVLDYIGVPYK